MTREEIRRENARTLAAQAGGPAAFAKKMGMSDSQVTQIIGRNYKKNIGNTVAKRIEAAFMTEVGWLDQRHKKEGNPNSADMQTANAPPAHTQANPLAVGATSIAESQVTLVYVTAQELDLLTEFRESSDDGKRMIIANAGIVREATSSAAGRHRHQP